MSFGEQPAGALPEDARVVAVIGHASRPEPAEAALSLARRVGERRGRTFLLDLAASPVLRALAGAEAGSPGLSDVLEGRASPREVAVRPGEDAPFVVLPWGKGPVTGDTLAGSCLAALLDRGRRGGGTFLLYVASGELPASLAERVDGHLWLRPAPADAAGPGPRIGASPPETAALSTRRRSRRPRLSGRPLVLAIVALGVLVLGGWLAARALRPAGEGAPAPAGAGTATSADSAGRGAAGRGAARDSSAHRGGADRAGAASAAEPGPSAATRLRRAPPAPYSVLLASYASFEDARKRAARLEDAASTVYFVTPTPVRDRLYFRLMAGALADTAAADSLMRRLVDRGVKERAAEWDIRPVRLAFRLGAYEDRAAAERARAEFLNRGIPAYLMWSAAGGDTAFAVYSGGFESGRAADALADRLKSSGVHAPLTQRRGEPR